MEYLSTSSLANELDMSPKELFEKFRSLGWIDRSGDKWVLTELGTKKGGQIKNNPRFGEYIVWPENISIDSDFAKRPKLLNATTIGKQFNVSNQRLNLILAELGWIEKDLSGWAVTKMGKNVGGKQFEHETSGGSYVLWPDTVVHNKNLLEVFLQNETGTDISKPSESNGSSTIQFEDVRLKFEAKLRTQDGHYVRSKAEMIIDNTLYQYGLVHAYERKLPIDEEVLSDFYLPAGKVYIEYWGLETDQKYLERKQKKLEIYKKHEIPLIELNDHDISNLDDHLPKKLLKFGIKVY
jgi:hypothetical protein